MGGSGCRGGAIPCDVVARFRSRSCEAPYRRLSARSGSSGVCRRARGPRSEARPPLARSSEGFEPVPAHVASHAVCWSSRPSKTPGRCTCSWMTEVVRALELGDDDPSARSAEDLADRCVVEELVRRVGDRRVALRLGRAREGAGVLERLRPAARAGSASRRGPLRPRVCLPLAGTVRNEPPQLAAPPGKTSAKSQPVSVAAAGLGVALRRRRASSRGQTNVANVAVGHERPAVAPVPAAPSWGRRARRGELYDVLEVRVVLDVERAVGARSRRPRAG